MKLIEFSNGTFGVRRYWFFGWHFMDLKSTNFAWNKGDLYFSHCQGTREEARLAIDGRTTGWHVVKD